MSREDRQWMRWVKCAGLVAALSVLEACCYGGAMGDCPNPGTVPSTGVVVGTGPIRGAVVCADLNSNGICDAGEPVSDVTAADGRYSVDASKGARLDIPPATDARPLASTAGFGSDHVASSKPDNVAPLTSPAYLESTFVAMVPATAVDTSKPDVPVGIAFTLRVPFGLGGVISPFSTLLQAGIAQGLTRAEADAAVRTQLQLGIYDLQSDYTASSVTGNPALVALASSIVAGLQAGAPVVVSRTAASVVDYHVRTLSFASAGNYTLRYYYAPTAPAGNGLYTFYDVRSGMSGGAAVAANTLYDSALLSSVQGWAPNTGATMHTIAGGSPSVLTYSRGYTYVTTRTASDVAGQSQADVARLAQDLTVNSSSTLIGVNPATLTGTLPAGAKVQKITTVGTATPVSYRVSDGFVGAPVTTLAGLATAYPAPSVPTSSNTVSMGSLHGSAGCGSAVCPQEVLRVAFSPAGGAAYYLCDTEIATGVQSNCLPSGSGTFAQGTAADNTTPIMTFADLPAAASVQASTRVFVERNGRVYFGFKDKIVTSTQTRLNKVAFEALAAALGITAPSISPVASPYIGAWTAAYSGDDSGSCPVGGIDAIGRLSGACSSTITGENFVVGGTVSANGAADFSSSGGASTGARFTGMLSGSSGAGTWTLPIPLRNGTWTASKLP